MNKREPYVHVLLFECRSCGCPVASAITSHNRSVEEVDSRRIPLRCACGWSAELLGTEAKKHLVEPWHARLEYQNPQHPSEIGQN
jgi:hypothetical protein